MKTSVKPSRERGLTLVELLVVFAVLAILASMVDFGAPRNAKARALRIQCVNNLKQIGVAARLWEGDHGENFP